MRVETGTYWIAFGEPFVVRPGIEIDTDGEVAIPISYMDNPGLVVMITASAWMEAAARGHLYQCYHDAVVACSSSGGRECGACGAHLHGWYCPDNPDGTGRCRYEDDEFCVYCGEPEERK